MPVTVVIITFNEEKNIERALASIQWCDDVIVVDSFSTDKTAEICGRYPNVRFSQNAFVDFATQRQFAIDVIKPKHHWVLALDADELVPAGMECELLEIAASYCEGRPVAYDVALRIFMWGRWLRYSSEYPRYWRRFFHHHYARYVQRGHADAVEADGPVAKLQYDLIHDDQKGLADWVERHNRYSTQEAAYAINELSKVSFRGLVSNDRLERRRAQKRVFRSMVGNSYIRFVYLYFVRLGFLDGWRGYALCRLRAHQHFIIKLKQYELRTVAERK